VLTLISLPILVAWGLPLSLASLAGNLIFMPFIGLFLLLSSLIFFTELVYTAPSILYFLLNSTCSWWQTILSYGNSRWLLTLSAPPLILSLIIPCSIIFYFARYRLSMPKKLSLVSCALLTQYLLIIGYHKTSQNNISMAIVPHLTFTYRNNSIDLCDDGAFNKHGLSASFIEYTVIPTLVKHCGQTSINHLSIKPGYGGFRLAHQLCELTSIKRLSIPFFEISSKKSWAAFFSLLRIAKEKNIIIKRIKPAEKKRKQPTLTRMKKTGNLILDPAPTGTFPATYH
jgi:hypothetical protein